jgi:hypothetical protein
MDDNHISEVRQRRSEFLERFDTTPARVLLSQPATPPHNAVSPRRTLRRRTPRMRNDEVVPLTDPRRISSLTLSNLDRETDGTLSVKGFG